MRLRSSTSRHRLQALALVAFVALLATACGTPAPLPPTASQGIVQRRVVPNFVLTNQFGRYFSFASLRGRAVVVVPFATAGQDLTPLATADLLSVRASIDRAGLASRVMLIEYSVDPQRDDPDRLRAYAQRTGASWTLLTGTTSEIDAVDRFFYEYASPGPAPAGAHDDWYTGRPLRGSVEHSTGYFLIGPGGHERFATSASPSVPDHRVPGALRTMLDVQGLQDLNDPGLDGQTWSVPELLAGLGWLVHRSIAAS